mmetsp:Transcript_138553/g.265976  ORF Transcript_138553/g.265976 Transcript_138553/m.265976 type:complete len:228 (-) Transcript_138553:2186-2869(-)
MTWSATLNMVPHEKDNVILQHTHSQRTHRQCNPVKPHTRAVRGRRLRWPHSQKVLPHLDLGIRQGLANAASVWRSRASSPVRLAYCRKASAGTAQLLAACSPTETSRPPPCVVADRQKQADARLAGPCAVDQPRYLTCAEVHGLWHELVPAIVTELTVLIRPTSQSAPSAQSAQRALSARTGPSDARRPTRSNGTSAQSRASCRARSADAWEAMVAMLPRLAAAELD